MPHSLSHWLGMDVHDVGAYNVVLAPGMVFSVEPGIYLPGVTGIRIEDIVVLEESGPRLLTNAPREPLVVS
jgi:Xaa-Pro aminopeptidase